MEVRKSAYDKLNDLDFRTHVVTEIYDTERSFVESLQTLKKYYETLIARPDILERCFTEKIFCNIPDIASHHEKMFSELKKRVEIWDGRQKIGDVMLESFSNEALINAYTEFVGNFSVAKNVLGLRRHKRPEFDRFLQQCTTEHPRKLNLDDLLIMPVQRIPRYELLLKALLKRTPEDHPDRMDLIYAKNAVNKIAQVLNDIEFLPKFVPKSRRPCLIS